MNTYFNEFRIKILKNSIKEHSKEFAVFELDESYFEARRIRGKMERGATGKTPVFWERAKRYGKSVRNCRSEFFKRDYDDCNARQDNGDTDEWSYGWFIVRMNLNVGKIT